MSYNIAEYIVECFLVAYKIVKKWQIISNCFPVVHQRGIHTDVHTPTHTHTRPTSSDVFNGSCGRCTNTDADRHTYLYTDDTYTEIHQSHKKSREVSLIKEQLLQY